MHTNKERNLLGEDFFAICRVIIIRLDLTDVTWKHSTFGHDMDPSSLFFLSLNLIDMREGKVLGLMHHVSTGDPEI